MHTQQTVIAETSKGHRVWLQGLAQYGWSAGTRFDVVFTGATIEYRRSDTGKRTVTNSKGVVIDTTSKKVTQWAQTSGHQFTTAEAVIEADIITIHRNT